MNAAQLGAFVAHFVIALGVGYIIIGLCWLVPKVRRDVPHVAYILGCIFAGLVAFVPVGGPDAMGLVAAALAIGFLIWRYVALKHNRLKVSANMKRAALVWVLSSVLVANLPSADAQGSAPRKTDMDLKTMTDFYDSCSPSCEKRQKSNPTSASNPAFFLSALCGCYCTRLATQLTAADVREMERTGKPNPRTSSIVARSYDVCLSALSAD